MTPINHAIPLPRALARRGYQYRQQVTSRARPDAGGTLAVARLVTAQSRHSGQKAIAAQYVSGAQRIWNAMRLAQRGGSPPWASNTRHPRNHEPPPSPPRRGRR